MHLGYLDQNPLDSIFTLPKFSASVLQNVLWNQLGYVQSEFDIQMESVVLERDAAIMERDAAIMERDFKRNSRIGKSKKSALGRIKFPKNSNLS